MFQIDNSTAATAQPASTSPGTPGFFTDGNPVNGTAPTVVPAEWLNAVMMELVNVVTGAGLTLNKAAFNQVLTAVKRLGQKTVVLTDTGAANAYTATNSPALAAGDLVGGLVQQVSIAHANTGASTYSPDGQAAAPIYGLALQPLQGGELPVGGVAVLMRATIAGVNSGNPIWILMECAGGAQQVPNATQSQHAVALGQIAQAIGTTAPQFDSTLKLATTAFVQRAMGNHNSVVGLTGSATLTQAQLGSFVEVTAGTGVVITLCSATGAGGGAFRLYNNTANSVTVSAATGQNINVNRTNVSSFTLLAGEACDIVTDGVSWSVINGIGASSLAANGYQKLPSGLIIQWGAFTANNGTSNTITLPITFPTAMVSVSAMTGANAGTDFNVRSVTFVSKSNSQFVVNVVPASIYAGYWMAIGY
ncbi:gp53-like domain-containing protein [Chromobacterium rhizoryzae]|uniref:gp53-like domain-containing protein n=1 Tax=Chromobacterium rhizoryzae TaxID=1778675 RepID=UPI001D077377|nr:hypothetical protein [Chromobacterium rhizoryzae]